MPDVLVTGGAGFIGSHLCAGLLRRGYRVRVLDNLSFGSREWLPDGVELLVGDIRQLADCRAATRGADGVFHLAAMSRAGPSLDDIDLCTQSNVTGTQNVLIAARDEGVRKLIYSGSSTCYGSSPPPHNELNTALQFLNFYSLSKHVGEKYCELFHNNFGMDCVILRYFNVYGLRQPQSGAYALVLGIFLRRWATQQPLEIHGSGAQRRDFVHVSDVVSANIRAMESDVTFDTFNVGSGANISVSELADLISPNQSFGPRRKGDAEETLADISHIQNVLGWAPQTTFEDGLSELLIHAKAGIEK